MEAHLDEKTDELIAEGLSQDDARAKARVEFGNRTRIVESCRREWSYVLFDEGLQDLRYAVRALRMSPLFSSIVVLSLALGVGSNALVFSVVDQVLLRALPYGQPDRLFAVWSQSAAHGDKPMNVSAGDFYDWQAQSRAFDSLAAYASWPMNLTGVEEPRRLETELVSAAFFTTLGVKPEIGRTFLSDEDREKSPAVVVLSHRLWQALGGSTKILGQQVTLNGTPSTVIGVMPSGFAFPNLGVDAWVPLSLNAQNRANREGRWLSVIGRIRPDVSTRGASAEMSLITRRLAEAYPATNAGWGFSLVPLKEEVVGKTRPILLTLQAGALLLLLITCANIANLLLAKGVSRTREMGLRAALGAGRGRLLRQLVVENSLLASLGGGAGTLLAWEGIVLVRLFGEKLIPQAADIQLNAPVAIFMAAVTLLTVLAFGLAPAARLSLFDLRAQLSSGGRGTQYHVERKRGVLVAIEIGLASVLLVAAVLLGESLFHLLSVHPGLRTERLLTIRLTLPRSAYPTNAAQAGFFDQVLDRVRAIPGVEDAGEISETPLKGNNPTFEFTVEGITRGPSEAPIQGGLRVISAGYLQSAGIPLLQGREFTTGDRSAGLPVALVNETMARRYWPGKDPMGRRVRFHDDERWMVVTGVVADVRNMGLKADEGPVLYVPYAQKTQDWLAWTTLMVRTAGEPTTFLPAIQTAIHSIDKNQPLAEAGTADGLLADATAMPRFITSAAWAVSGLALLIAAVGIYGLIAFTVAQRMPEFGIYLALGASPSRIGRILFQRMLVRVMAGVGAGLVGAWWMARSMESLLFGVKPHDAGTYAGVACVLIVVSAVATVGPARRAMKADPLRALRFE
jgi:putative ABC transport system permease protein